MQNTEGFAKFFDFFGAETGLLMVVLIVMFCWKKTLLKLSFDKEFLAGTSIAAFLIRTARYAIIIFLIFGVYPMMFPLFERVGKKAYGKWSRKNGDGER